MATPTLGLLNHTLLTAADSSTGWTLLTTAEPDLKKEGTNSMSGIFRATLATGYYTNGTAVSAVGKTIRAWMNTTNIPYMQTEASGGYQFLMYDGTTTEYKVAVGSDTYDGGWKNFVIDSALFTTLTLANAIRWGWRCNHTASAKNAINMWADAIRYLDGYYATGGTTSDKIRLSDIALVDKGTTTLNGYGVITAIDGVYFGTGKLVIGNGATSTYFEMNGTVLVFTDQDVATGLYQVTGAGSGAHVLITNSTLKSSGTTDNTRFLIDMDDADITDVVITNNVINRAAACTFKSGQTITNNRFNDCGQITPSGADMKGSIIEGYVGTADTASLIWNVATDPDGYVDNIEFTKGTTATHAIQFGTSAPTTMTLRGLSFSGYNASDAQNDSALYFSDKGTNTTWTVNLIGCSGTISYKKVRSGDVVNLVIDPVTLSVTVTDIETGDPISGARVLIEVSDGTNYPYQEPISMTGTGTTVTVVHSGHGMATNDYVVTLGATNDDDYNGVHQITVTGTDGYTFTSDETISVSPATGTLTATFAPISGTTDVNGEISDSRSYGSPQPIMGWVRKGSSQPYYKQQPVVDTISNTAGLSLNIQLIGDE